MRHVGANLAHVGAILGPSWLMLAPSDSILAPSWGHLGATERPKRSLWCRLGVSWTSLGRSWSRLGPIWSAATSAASNLAPSGTDLEPSEPKFGSILRSLGWIFKGFQHSFDRSWMKNNATQTVFQHFASTSSKSRASNLTGD